MNCRIRYIKGDQSFIQRCLPWHFLHAETTWLRAITLDRSPFSGMVLYAADLCQAPLIQSELSNVPKISRTLAVHSERDHGRDRFNKNSNRSDREKWSTSKGGPVFSKLFRLDRTDSLSFGPKFPEILVEWIAPHESSG